MFRSVFLTGGIMWIVVIIILVCLLKEHTGYLHKSHYNKKISGVCGGLGEYLDIDPTIIRIIWVIVTLCGGSGILAYIIAAIVMSD